jgi:tRNA A-37 threonylcarbamoyl transferase component Bud32
MKRKGGEVIGKGSEGCVVNSFSCNDFKNGEYVVKFVKSGVEDNYEQIQEILQNNDPNEERYALYHLKNANECSVSHNDLKRCEKILKSSIKTDKFYLTKLLSPIKNERELTRAQYRHLKKSVTKLRDIGIHHGDLIGNVMLNKSNLPVIIDWGHNSRLLTDDDSEMVKNFDYMVFQENFGSNWTTKAEQDVKETSN